MNQSELDALRKKHAPLELSQGKIDPVSFCKGCAGPGGTMSIKWPCDLIKVLDATEPDPDCDHLTEIDEGSCYISFNYCPKCGEKL